MATPEFSYQNPFPLSHSETAYRLLSTEGVSSGTFEGMEVLKIEPAALAFLSRAAMHDCSFMLREAHLRQVASILEDPEASENDRYVALTLLKNAEIAAQGILPFCQDTGTATVVGKKGQRVWTSGNDVTLPRPG